MGGGSKPFLHLLAEPLRDLQEGLIRETHVVEILVNLEEVGGKQQKIHKSNQSRYMSLVKPPSKIC